MYLPTVHKFVQYLDNILIDCTQEELQQKRKNWQFLSLLYKWRLLFSRWRGEKWIRRLWLHNTTSWHDIASLDSAKNWIYALVHPKIKRIYIGETSKTVIQRFAKHVSDVKCAIDRNLFHYLKKHGIENWLPFPLQHLPDKVQLKTKEKEWMHKWHDTMINDSTAWTKNPKLWNPTDDKYNKPKPLSRQQHQQKRIEKKLAWRYEWRGQAMMVLRNNKWRKWASSTLIGFLNNVRAAHIPKFLEHKLVTLVKAHLYASHGIQLRAMYILRLETAPNLNRIEISKWVGRLLHNKLDDNNQQMATYIARHTKVVLTSTRKLKQLVNTGSKSIKDIDISNPDNHATCYCHLYSDLLKGDSKHVYIKALDLPTPYNDLRSILTISSKNPVHFNDRQYLGRQFNNIRAFLSQLKLDKSWSTEQNNQLLDLLWRPKTYLNRALDFHFITSTIQKYKGLVNVQLDKNSNTWVVSCKQYYQQLTFNHFNQDNHYERAIFPPVTAKEVVLQYFELWKIADIAKKRQIWKIGQASVLPKDKDIHRLRPLVSYYNFLAKPAGKIVARALSLIIRTLGSKWQTFDLFSTKDFVTKIKQWNSNLKDKPQADYTFVKFNIKNQFTELNKNTVLSELSDIFNEIDQKWKNSSHISIARRLMDKKRDRWGKGNKRDFITIQLNQIFYYCQFEIQNPYFQVGKTVFFQKNGLPMGGLVSAGMAVIDAMYKEQHNQKLWQTSMSIKWTQFCDDILAVIPGKLNNCQITAVKDNLQQLYGNNLEVVQEESSYDHISFLDYNIAFNNSQFYTWAKNKNLDLVYNAPSKRIIRYPEPSADLHYTIFQGMMIGGIKKAIRYSNTPALKLLSTIQIIMEWCAKGYFFKQIYNALHLAQSQYPTHFKPWIIFFRQKRHLLQTLLNLA